MLFIVCLTLGTVGLNLKRKNEKTCSRINYYYLYPLVLRDLFWLFYLELLCLIKKTNTSTNWIFAEVGSIQAEIRWAVALTWPLCIGNIKFSGFYHNFQCISPFPTQIVLCFFSWFSRGFSLHYHLHLWFFGYKL